MESIRSERHLAGSADEAHALERRRGLKGGAADEADEIGEGHGGKDKLRPACKRESYTNVEAKTAQDARLGREVIGLREGNGQDGIGQQQREQCTRRCDNGKRNSSGCPAGVRAAGPVERIRTLRVTAVVLLLR